MNSLKEGELIKVPEASYPYNKFWYKIVDMSPTKITLKIVRNP